MSKELLNILLLLFAAIELSLIFYIDLDGGKHSLLALEKHLSPLLAERVIAEGEREIRRHELLTPSALALHTVRVLIRL